MAKINFVKNDWDRADYKKLYMDGYMLCRDFIDSERSCRPCNKQIQEDGVVTEITQADYDAMLELFKTTAVSFNELNTKIQNMIKSAGL